MKGFGLEVNGIFSGGFTPVPLASFSYKKRKPKERLLSVSCGAAADNIVWKNNRNWA